MKIIKISKNDLLPFLDSDIYKNSRNIPITKLRAVSQTKNPRATNDDVLLIVAVNNSDQIIGYIGALPEKLPDFPEIKLAWNSCWWVEKGQPSNISFKLLLEFFKSYNNNVMMRDMTETTKKIILSFNKFEVFKELKAKKFFYRLNFASKYSKIFKPFDFVINFVLSTNLKIRFLKKNKKYRIEYLNNFSDDDNDFILKKSKNEAFKRNIIDLNWILDNPWVIPGKEKDIYQEKYYFSSVKNNFSNDVIRIKDSRNKTVAILMLTKTDNNLETPYVYFDPNDIQIVGQTILNHIIKNNIFSYITFNKHLQNWFSKQLLSYFYQKTLNKEFVTNKDLKPYFADGFDFQDGEGDYVFA